MLRLEGVHQSMERFHKQRQRPVSQLLRQSAFDSLERLSPLLPIACVLQRINSGLWFQHEVKRGDLQSMHEVVESLIVAGTHA